jgi:hypothetical protein
MKFDHLVTDKDEKLYPVLDYIVFKFCANLTNFKFQPISKGGIVISDVEDYVEHTLPQWAEIIALGPEVSEEIRNAKYVLIEPQMWTHKVRYGGPHGEFLWKTEEKYIMCVSDEYLNPY